VGSAADRALSGDVARAGADLVFLLGAAPNPPAGDGPVIRWLGHAPQSTPAARAGERLIAPAGACLWSRRPWPAADALFELPAGPEPHTALLVGDRDGLRDTLLAGAAERVLDLQTVDS